MLVYYCVTGYCEYYAGNSTSNYGIAIATNDAVGGREALLYCGVGSAQVVFDIEAGDQSGNTGYHPSDCGP
jgi:hypothetical protein